MTAIPTARPLAAGIVFPRIRPVVDVHLVVMRFGHGRFRYRAQAGGQQWHGEIQAGFARVALLDVVVAVRREIDTDTGLRVVARFPGPPVTHPHATALEAHFPGVRIEIERGRDAPDLDRIQRRLTHEIRVAAHRLPVLTIGADGSVTRRHSGYGWLSEHGDHGSTAYADTGLTRHRDRIVVAELRAVAAAVDAHRGRRLKILSDSRNALALLDRWRTGERALPHGYDAWKHLPAALHTLHDDVAAEHSQVAYEWVPGHRGQPLNEGADSLARLATRRADHPEALTEREHRRRAADLAAAFSAPGSSLAAAS
ncbi:MAG: hypothetical protein QM809_01760 [Gordonia sp. (in: high G+C Gram-positive bacteria)]|uniref:ribonuclease HI n=1 Tax=Gordonia sp. (in: high G+C Gram-positive bacteria) TaxID=84139 RepID=UPI0039E466D6